MPKAVSNRSDFRLALAGLAVSDTLAGYPDNALLDTMGF